MGSTDGFLRLRRWLVRRLFLFVRTSGLGPLGFALAGAVARRSVVAADRTVVGRLGPKGSEGGPGGLTAAARGAHPSDREG